MADWIRIAKWSLVFLIETNFNDRSTDLQPGLRFLSRPDYEIIQTDPRLI